MSKKRNSKKRSTKQRDHRSIYQVIRSGKMSDVINRIGKGLMIRWQDTDPMGDQTEQTEQTMLNDEVTHCNPVKRLNAMEAWANRKSDFLVYEHACWKIRITPVFKYPNGLEQGESRLIPYRGALVDLAHACENPILESQRFGAHMAYMEFEVECLGNRSVQESDWEDYEDPYISEVEIEYVEPTKYGQSCGFSANDEPANSTTSAIPATDGGRNNAQRAI